MFSFFFDFPAGSDYWPFNNTPLEPDGGQKSDTVATEATSNKVLEIY